MEPDTQKARHTVKKDPKIPILWNERFFRQQYRKIVSAGKDARFSKHCHCVLWTTVAFQAPMGAVTGTLLLNTAFCQVCKLCANSHMSGI